MKNKRNTVFGLFAVTCLVLCLAGASRCFDSTNVSCDETVSSVRQEVRSVVTEKVEKQAVARITRYSGVVEAYQRAKLFFRVDGPLISIDVSPGDHVKKGDVLMRIDPRDFINEVESIKAKLLAARSRLLAMKEGARPEDIKLLEAALQSAQSKVRFTDAEYKRCHALYCFHLKIR